MADEASGAAAAASRHNNAEALREALSDLQLRQVRLLLAGVLKSGNRYRNVFWEYSC